MVTARSLSFAVIPLPWYVGTNTTASERDLRAAKLRVIPGEALPGDVPLDGVAFL